jgi:serine/threonine protein kinase
MTQLNLIGRTLGGFEILEELGRGGMSVVYKARQQAPNRIVALKMLAPQLSLHSNHVQRFHQEANSIAALQHPHIVPIYTVGEDQGFHFLAMQYIQGETLRDLMQREGPLSLERSISLLEQAAQALDYAHSQQVIHRDIKPSNMMLTDKGWLYLTDFGLARDTMGNSGLTSVGMVMGTPEYISPEQAQGLATIGPPTDIYAFGVVLFEALTGHLPFVADTAMAMIGARLMDAPRAPRFYRPDLPFDVDTILLRALARQPEMRYQTAMALINDLQLVAQQAALWSQAPQPQTPWPQQAQTPQPQVPSAPQPQTPWPQQGQTPQPQTPWPQQAQTPQPQTPWPQQGQTPQPQARSTPQPQARLTPQPQARLTPQPSSDPNLVAPAKHDRSSLRLGFMIGLGISVSSSILFWIVMLLTG